MPTCVLSQAADDLAQPFTHLLWLSLDTEYLPAEWKSALLTPIQKKGSKTRASNCRPVILTCILCKVMEKLVRDQMMKQLQSNNKATLIGKEEKGFLPIVYRITA